jgi:hypothetical protein
MEDESPNEYITITRSAPLLMKIDDKHVIGCVVSQMNELTAQHTQYHEIIDPSPPEKEVFKMLLEKEFVPIYRECTVISYD